MKCANCGAEIRDGRLYCERCGEEIKIVPEFDLEFERQINETIESMAKDVADETQESSKETAFQELDEVDGITEEWNDAFSLPDMNLLRMKYGRLLATVIAGIIVLAVFLFLFFRYAHINSYEYQYEKALAYADNNQTEEAIVYMKKALAVNPDNEDAQFLLAHYYYEAGHTENAILLLQELIYAQPDNLEEVYDALINIYIEENAFSEIGLLLKECNNVKILSKYNSYVADVPVFNKPGGEYDELISITLEGNTSGSVFYTLDGSEPNVTSTVYDNPILLESGKYIIKAIFVNTYGVQSDVATMEYDINIVPPKPPTVKLDSGTYDEPQLIEVYYETNTKVYYTLDGTVPTTKSNRYTEPLEMPVGISNFNFIVVDANGLTSELVQRTYHLTMAAYLTPELAKQVLLNNLEVGGIIKDQAGHITGKLGYNSYEVRTAVRLDGVVYYILSENYVDTTGMVHDANRLYAIDAVTGSAYNAYKTGEGQYTLRAL